ncbi:MAG TPA: pilus assembly protein PilZ [Bacillus bacterium]|nr:pilus assembly protein PilZ [Bacillus sp. (in: firmicutes)]
MLNVGDTLSIEIKNADEFERFRSKIVDRRGEQLFIDYPVSEKTGKIAFFLDGTEIRVSFHAKDSAVYMFDSQIVGRKKENIPMIIISYPGKEKLLRIQRREFVRIDSTLDIAVHPVNNEDFQPFTSITVDISAGGAAILLPTNHKIKSQMQLFCYLVLPLSNGEYYYIKALCKTIRIISGTKGSKDIVSIQFLNLSQSETQQITRYCFDKQLSERKRGR